MPDVTLSPPHGFCFKGGQRCVSRVSFNRERHKSGDGVHLAGFEHLPRPQPRKFLGNTGVGLASKNLLPRVRRF